MSSRRDTWPHDNAFTMSRRFARAADASRSRARDAFGPRYSRLMAIGLLTDTEMSYQVSRPRPRPSTVEPPPIVCRSAWDTNAGRLALHEPDVQSAGRIFRP